MADGGNLLAAYGEHKGLSLQSVNARCVLWGHSTGEVIFVIYDG